MGGLKSLSKITTMRSVAISIMILLVCAGAAGQERANSATADQVTIQQLLQRIEQLEARVSQLEARDHQTNVGGSAAAAAPVASLTKRAASADPPPSISSSEQPPETPASGESEQVQSMSAMNDRMDLSKTLLRIRGFGDVDLQGDTKHGDTTSFSLGQLDLFITSDVADHYRFLSEVVFEAGPDNIYGVLAGPENTFGVDIERYLLQYSYNDFFNLAVGRGHTAIGYYNTAFHHSTWLQTTTERPFLFEFEDRGGILPIHIVGATASGRIPSGSLGLHYVAEIGNGRESRNPLGDEPCCGTGSR